MARIQPQTPVFVSIGLVARDAADTIEETLESLFRQTLFARLRTRGQLTEIVCVDNGSSDDTARIAADFIKARAARRGGNPCFNARVYTARGAGRHHAWNLFVHRFSSPHARYLILMEAGAVFGHATTLWSLCQTLEKQPKASVSFDAPIKDLAMKRDLSRREKLSLATADLAQSSEPSSSRLYCIRSSIARRIRLPRDLPDGDIDLITRFVRTDFETRELHPERIARAKQASHIFDAYAPVVRILKDRTRQLVGQTFVHVLMDRFLPGRSASERAAPAQLIQHLDTHHPGWLHRMAVRHARRHFFWQLYPGILASGSGRSARRREGTAFLRFPGQAAGFALRAGTAWAAARSLRHGVADTWPDKKIQPQERNRVEKSAGRADHRRSFPSKP